MLQKMLPKTFIHFCKSIHSNEENGAANKRITAISVSPAGQHCTRVGIKIFTGVRKNTTYRCSANMNFIKFSEFLHFFSPRQLRNIFIIELS